MRTCKIGLDYWPLDIDLFEDEKIQFVSAKYGELGELITIKLLCKIYRQGYFMKWGDDEALLFSNKAGNNISFDLVSNVIDELLERDFFNKAKFKDYGILTSRGVQKRFLEATKRRRNNEMYQEYLLCNINGYNVTIKQLNEYIGTQRKGKESKGKESKKSKGCALPLSDTKDEILTEATMQKITQEIDKIVDHLYQDKIFPDAPKFKNTMFRQNKNPRAVLHALIRCSLIRPPADEAWAYCTKIIKTENGNYNERDFRKTQN